MLLQSRLIKLSPSLLLQAHLLIRELLILKQWLILLMQTAQYLWLIWLILPVLLLRDCIKARFRMPMLLQQQLIKLLGDREAALFFVIIRILSKSLTQLCSPELRAARSCMLSQARLFASERP